MIDTRLIMLEGLAGTGKSTNSYHLLMQLERAGCAARWIHEVARPHPTSFFDEASLTRDEFDAFMLSHPEAGEVLRHIATYRKNTVAVDLLDVEWHYLHKTGQASYLALKQYDVWNYPLEKYVELALEKWACFAERALCEKDSVYILDGSFFQYQIFTFLLKNAPYMEIERFVRSLLDIISPLNPVLFYLYRENINDAIDYLIKTRGAAFIHNIWDRDKQQPYYQDKPRGAESHMQFLKDYASIAMRLFDALCCKKSAIEVTDEKWPEYEDDMLNLLGIRRAPPPRFMPPDGVYRHSEQGFEITVSGLSAKDPNGRVRSLTPKSAREFHIECLPAVLCFDAPGRLVISGEQICERWTTTGLAYYKT